MPVRSPPPKTAKTPPGRRAAIICPRGAVSHLIAELKELGIAAKECGSDWAEASLTEKQEHAIVRDSLLTLRFLRIIATAATAEEIVEAARSIRPTGTFAVRADGPDRQTIQEDVGGAIHDSSNAPVNLSKPDMTYFVHDDAGTLVLGEQVAELGKRHYKIITGPFSLAGPVAAAILRASRWDAASDIVAWPCGTGELAIEAAFWAARKSPRAYDLKDMGERPVTCAIVAADPRLPMVSSAQKNAKIAGVTQHIRFSRQDLDWLDTKHDERGVMTMVGLLPNLKLVPKFVPELFYQLDFILATQGMACFACVNDDSAEILTTFAAEKAERRYTVTRSHVWTGQQALILISLVAAGKRRQKKEKIPV